MVVELQQRLLNPGVWCCVRSTLMKSDSVASGGGGGGGGATKATQFPVCLCVCACLSLTDVFAL